MPVILLNSWPACRALLRSLCPRLRDRRSFESLHPFLILTPNSQARLVFSICASDYLGFVLVSFLHFLFLFAGLCLPAVLICSLGSSVASCGGFVSISVSSLASAFWGRPYSCPHGDGADAGTNASGASARSATTAMPAPSRSPGLSESPSISNSESDLPPGQACALISRSKPSKRRVW